MSFSPKRRGLFRSLGCWAADWLRGHVGDRTRGAALPLSPRRLLWGVSRAAPLSLATGQRCADPVPVAAVSRAVTRATPDPDSLWLGPRAPDRTRAARREDERRAAEGGAASAAAGQRGPQNLCLEFCLINAGVLYLYFSNYLQIDEEEYGGTWELTKEGFMTSFALFMVIWIIFYTAIHYD
ncbi:uncharacterized protein C20orf24 homolog isoform X1 [Heterocephalus glaber]|uniref:Uncharacterized protein C20orf24 homolog isoform X1 n=1 Tax=Heterocephalus glaber TaxID=10181 RepID=A0AAX6S0N4_HETGA|nr:uncharacterized protein C20orf24 homolog isoform X1 [Heterocephalus glaber]